MLLDIVAAVAVMVAEVATLPDEARDSTIAKLPHLFFLPQVGLGIRRFDNINTR